MSNQSEMFTGFGITFKASETKQGIVLVMVDGEAGWMTLHAAEELLKQLKVAVLAASGSCRKSTHTKRG